MEKEKIVVNHLLICMRDGLWISGLLTAWDILCAAYVLHRVAMEDKADLMECFVNFLNEHYEDILKHEGFAGIPLDQYPVMLEPFLRMVYFPDKVSDEDMCTIMKDELEDWESIPRLLEPGWSNITKKSA